MIYLIEGLDGTGKTTLAAALATATGGAVLKLPPEKTHNDYRDDFVVAYTLAACAPEDATLILDRCVLSGLAYEDGMNDAQRFDLWQEWLSILHGRKLELLHLTAPNSVRLKRDYEGFTKHVPATDYNAFATLAGQKYSEGRLTYRQINTGYDSVEKIVRDVLDDPNVPVSDLTNEYATVAISTVPRCELQAYTNDYVRLFWPKTEFKVGKQAFQDITISLKQLWNVDRIPAKEPRTADWIINPRALAMRGSVEQMADDMRIEYKKHGYDADIVVLPPYDVPYEKAHLLT